MKEARIMNFPPFILKGNIVSRFDGVVCGVLIHIFSPLSGLCAQSMKCSHR